MDDDMKAPERIWAGVLTDEYRGMVGTQLRVWGDDPKVGTDEIATEYVRADLHDTTTKLRDELAAEVERLTTAHNTVCGALAVAIERATKAEAERDAALARAAAAAMETNHDPH